MSGISRRQFVKYRAQGVALAAIPMIFKFNPASAFATPSEGPGKLRSYYEHFGVSEEIIRQVMGTALSKGGDYCDLYFQHSISNTVVLEDNSVSRAYSNVDFGVGIRVVEGDQTGFSFTELMTPESMKLAAATAANIASDSRAPAPSELQYMQTPNYYPIETRWEDVKIDQKIPYLEKINERVTARDNRIVKTRIYFSDGSTNMLLATSDGRVVTDYQPMTRIYVSCTGEQNGRRENSGYNIAGREGIELFTEANINLMADQAVDRTVALFEAIKPDAGEMPVVLGSGGSGILLHEAIGHPIEADFNRKNESIFADKIGKPGMIRSVSTSPDGKFSVHVISPS